MGLWDRFFGFKAGASEPPDKKGAISTLAETRKRTVCVFVSSTFSDMEEDRNVLMAKVWPQLRKFCSEISVEFVEVDLRWGVSEKQEKRKEMFRHCLAEVGRCRPFFVGLLGERYGTLLDREHLPPVLHDNETWLEKAIGERSLTELEIRHGVLRHKHSPNAPWQAVGDSERMGDSPASGYPSHQGIPQEGSQPFGRPRAASVVPQRASVAQGA